MHWPKSFKKKGWDVSSVGVLINFINRKFMLIGVFFRLSLLSTYKLGSTWSFNILIISCENTYTKWNY